jgi:hypothetical protein
MLVTVLALPVSAVLANWLLSPAVIVDDLENSLLPNASEEGITWQPDDQTFYAKGRHWIFYLNEDTDITYRSALSDGVFGTETDLVASSGLYGWEMAVWYDAANDKVHYARHDMTPVPDEVKYRMGTPNMDGTITWAAVEQTVHTTPAALNNWRTTICVDEEGFPWVAWIDTDGTNTFAVTYVENSTTKNGTWTQGTLEIFGSGGTCTNLTGTMTGSPVTLDIGANTPTVTVAGTFTVHINKGGSGTATTGGWVITGSPVALTEGDNVIIVEAGGGGTITLDLDYDQWAWFVGLTPVDSDKQIQVAFSQEDTTGGINDGLMSLIACLYDDDTGWDAPQEVLPPGELYTTAPYSFDFYDHGSAMWVVYTDDLGVVRCGARSQIQNWAEASWGLVKSAGIPYYPTLSGYRTTAGGGGEDLICIMHCAVEIGYKVHTFGADMNTWSTWVTAWTVPDIANDIISRHIATYRFSSPLGFAWQWYDDSEDLDTVNYWWIDNTNDQLGYYGSGLATVAQPLAIIIPIIFMGLAILVLLALAFADNINLKMLIYIAIAIMLILAFLATMNTQINTF